MDLRISHRQTTFWEFSGATETQRVHFVQKQEQSFVAPECDAFQVVSDHPVLLDYRYAWRSVYIGSAATEPVALLENLAAGIAQVVGSWRPSADYFNDMVDPLDILAGGSGLLLYAPQPIADHACAELDRAGVRYSSMPYRPAMWPMQALIADTNFVVAREFRVERGPNNSFKPKPLRGSA